MKFVAGGLLALFTVTGAAWAQNAPVGGIYTCVDAQGRKLTSDRPIPECLDREQKVLNPSGTVKQKVGPSLTAAERAQQEAREKQQLEEQNRLAEEHRRDRALLIRYPSKAVHDKERAEALAQIDVVSKAADLRLNELAAQRKKLDDEMEFYKKDPSKAPMYLKRQVEDNKHSVEVQKQFIAEQESESRRVNERFDLELTRLRQLWAASAASK
ncbi:DUF4124 domain-containing protein [Rhodoferax sp. GW822-FHT02A01]|uniref:DUF4124 domain-containing protein n=1 Tax=Rhodoferax sp. GW822-FHT02A01 TaxID=3141537 RepID=UPI00315DF270